MAPPAENQRPTQPPAAARFPPPRPDGAIDCIQAAKIYGGVLIMDRRRRRPPPQNPPFKKLQ